MTNPFNHRLFNNRIGLLVAAVFILASAGSFILSPPVVRGVSSSIVISEFRTRGPNGGSDEFVELFNKASAPVNIGGWKIRASNSGGTVGTRVTITAGTILNAGCYYLVTNSSTSGGPYSGPVPGNQTYATGITDDGGIAITLPDDTIVDQVGMSAGSAFKEGGTLAQLTTNTNRSHERKPGGALGSGTDTDNNAADFQLISPSDPQNTASVCFGTGPTNPSGVGNADPNTIPAGGTTLLTVAVTAGTNPTSTGLAVACNLTPIAGSATQPFFDDGTNGDLLAGDNIFSFSATAGAAATAGAKTLAVTITDAQSRSGTTTISLSIEPPLIAIHDIQGSGTASPLAGQLVSTTGIVTARESNGFFIQAPDAETDQDPDTSEGIAVFTGSTPPSQAAVGNLVKVIGTVAEFRPSGDPASPPLTEIAGSPTVSVIAMGNPLPAAVTITAVDAGPGGSLEQIERLEGMRVHVDSLAVVSPSQGLVIEASAIGLSNGMFFGVITGVPRPFREPGIELPNPLPPGSPCCVPRFDANSERLRVDSDAQPGALRLDVTTGATVSNITGVLDYFSRAYTILPDPSPTPMISGNLSAAPVPSPSSEEFTVASFNLERFFDTVNDPDVGDVALTPAAFNNRLTKASLAIRNVMQSPDIIGVQEAEKLSVLQAIAARVNADAVAAGGPDPGYQAFLEEGNDPGGIDVGFLVKASRVIVIDVVQEGKGATFIDPNNGLPDILNDRPPLILRASVIPPAGPAFPVTVIANHLRSLIDVEDPIDGNRVRVKRRAQAEFLANLIQTRQTADPNERIISLGDYNAFQFSDGLVDVVGTIKGAPAPLTEVVLASPDLVDPDLTNLVDTAAADQRYSFLNNGNAQVLDHVLITENLLARNTRFHYARNNADFPEVFRSDPSRPERVSDHDMPVAYFSFPRADLSVAKSAAPDPVQSGSSLVYTMTVVNSGPDAAQSVALTDTLPSGTSFESLSAPSGWSCTTPGVGQTGTITCTNTTMAAGSSAAFTLTAGVACSSADGLSLVNSVSVASAVHDPDTADNSSSTEVTVSNSAPVIIGPAVDKPVLRPPNHKMVDVTVGYTTADNCGNVVCTLSVTSNEPINGTDDGNTTPDWEVIDEHRVRLRAERSGVGSGRVYTITIRCVDSAGNVSTSNVTVTVPLNQS